MESSTAVQGQSSLPENFEQGMESTPKPGKINKKTVWHIHPPSTAGNFDNEAWIARQVMVNVMGCLIIFAMGLIIGYFVGVRIRL